MLNIEDVEVVSNETNTDVRMYNLFIRWSALLDVQVGTEILKGITLAFYTIATMEENKWELLLGDNWHWHINRITIARETVTGVKCHSVVCSRLTPVSVNGDLCWLLITQTVGETCECHSNN